jgi:hypothetical protein
MVSVLVCPDCIPLAGGDDVLLCEKCLAAQKLAESESAKVEEFVAADSGDKAVSYLLGHESMVYLLGQLLSVNQRMLAVLETAASADGVGDELRVGERLTREEVFEKKAIAVGDSVEEEESKVDDSAVVVDWRCDACLNVFSNSGGVCPTCRSNRVHVCGAVDVIVCYGRKQDSKENRQAFTKAGYMRYQKPGAVYVKYEKLKQERV